MTTTLPNIDRARRKVTLPTRPLLAAAWFGSVVAGGAWAAVAWTFGSPEAAVSGLLAAAVVGVAATVALLGLQPWRAKPLSLWPFLWVGGSFVRMVITLAGAYLLYSATPHRTASLWFAVIVSYLAAMACEIRVYALSMRRFDPSTTE